MGLVIGAIFEDAEVQIEDAIVRLIAGIIVEPSLVA
jgi:hypothetical protein